ncbi:MAG: hypothetical protein ABJA34_07650 [Pseudonocardiales bacterium]
MALPPPAADRSRVPGRRAEALPVSIQRLYLASGADPPTGTMRIPVAG